MLSGVSRGPVGARGEAAEIAEVSGDAGARPPIDWRDNESSAKGAPVSGPERPSRRSGGASGDLLLAIGLSATLVISLAAEGLLHGADNLLETACAVGAFCCLIPRRADPQLSAIAAAILFAASAALGSLATIPSELGDLIAIPAFLLAYSLGTEADQRRSVIALLLLTVGLQIANGRTTFNPILLVLTIGPWAAGLVVRSRRA
jgi:hypothetical protein